MYAITLPAGVSTELSWKNAWLSVSYLCEAKVKKGIRDIIGKARRQLKWAGLPSMIYLESVNHDLVQEYLQNVMLQDEYSMIPLVIVCDGSNARYIRRQRKPPKDESLCEILTVLDWPGRS